MPTVTRTPTVAIHIRPLAPTNTVGQRLRVWRADRPYSNDPARRTIAWDYALDPAANAVAALEMYLAGRDGAWNVHPWAVASTRDGWVAVQTTP